jgi:hypothetical protein
VVITKRSTIASLGSSANCLPRTPRSVSCGYGGLSRVCSTLLWRPRIVASNSSSSAQGVGAKVKAPFTVVDNKGVVIFQVRDQSSNHARGFALANAKGIEVAYATVSDTVTMFKVRSADGTRESALGAVSSFIGVNVRLKEKLRTTFGMGSTLLPSLEMFTADEKPIVAVMESVDTHGGLLQLGDNGGMAKVKAGIDSAGVGLVQAMPLGSPGAGLVGMPGTFLRGREGGQ